MTLRRYDIEAMSWWPLLVLCATACGRLQFAPVEADAGDSPDARVCLTPAGHDEDGDGVDDACDVCPALVDDQADGDGDGVGDACDPKPAIASERLAFFDPFTMPSPQWDYGTGVLEPDQLRMSSLSSNVVVRVPGPPVHEQIEIHTNVLAVTGPGQISIQFVAPPLQTSYYCELYQTAALKYLSATFTYDGVAYDSVSKVDLPAPFGAGPITLLADHSPPNYGCTATVNGATYHVEGPIPGGMLADLVVLAMNNTDIAVTSITRVATTP